MKPSAILITLVALGLACPWPASAQPAGGPGGARSPGLESQEPPGPSDRSGPPGGPGGGGPPMMNLPQLTPEQQNALRAFNQATAPQEQAVNEARNALNASMYREKPDPTDLKAKVDALAAAELARALARAEAFAKMQASPGKLTLPPPQIMQLMNMRSGRGGFPGPGGGPGGGPAGFGGPGGAPGGGPDSRQTAPPIKGGFQWID